MYMVPGLEPKMTQVRGSQLAEVMQLPERIGQQSADIRSIDLTNFPVFVPLTDNALAVCRFRAVYILTFIDVFIQCNMKIHTRAFTASLQ